MFAMTNLYDGDDDDDDDDDKAKRTTMMMMMIKLNIDNLRVQLWEER